MMGVLNTIAACVSAFAMIATAIIAWVQLSKVNKTINYSSLMSNFEIEVELNKRKEKLSELRTEIERYVADRVENAENDEVKNAVQIMNNQYNEYVENYLNIFDRLCYYIMRGKLSDDDFRTEYRTMLNDTIKGFDKYFKTGTRYQNMVELDKLWRSK